MGDTEQGLCWISTGSLKLEELDPRSRHVNGEGLGWERLPVELAIDRLAMRAYHAYGAANDYRNYQGLPLPEWQQLPESVQNAWKNSVQSVLFESGYAEGLSQPGMQLNDRRSDKPFLIP
ncbi:MAG: hypothetical protein HC781_01565 [Leptolyngbyaceae cyanobacterium CSU_1_4]|nr:hypothetical protein [Leptolyngbyaceae cyanobacterium CSU_1_4]